MRSPPICLPWEAADAVVQAAAAHNPVLETPASARTAEQGWDPAVVPRRARAQALEVGSKAEVVECRRRVSAAHTLLTADKAAHLQAEVVECQVLAECQVLVECRVLVERRV